LTESSLKVGASRLLPTVGGTVTVCSESWRMARDEAFGVLQAEAGPKGEVRGGRAQSRPSIFTQMWSMFDQIVTSRPGPDG
jgi:hypothetical protein